MAVEITRAFALVDWHNVQKHVDPEFYSNPRKRLPDALLSIQQRLATALRAALGGARTRVQLRIYHGWHQDREATTARRDFAVHSSDPSLARKIGDCAFVGGLQFGNELLCYEGEHPVYSTWRGSEQKMVDSSIICDALHAMRSCIADVCVIVSDDDDFIPLLLTAKAWRGGRLLLLRPKGIHVSHVTDVDCERDVYAWSAGSD